MKQCQKSKLLYKEIVQEALSPIFWWLHGYGAHASDLTFLSSFFKGRHIFLQAPLEIDSNKYSWFDIKNYDFHKDPFPTVDIPALKDFYLQPDYLGGFSQGALVAFSYAQVRDLEALILFSPPILKGEKKLKKCFLSHGFLDEVIPFKCSEKTLEYLKMTCENIHYCFFQGGHKIPKDVIEKLQVFL